MNTRPHKREESIVFSMKGRSDLYFSLLFVAAAAVTNLLSGYSLRLFVLSDILAKTLATSPILLTILCAYKIEASRLRTASVLFFGSIATFIVAAFAGADIPGANNPYFVQFLLVVAFVSPLFLGSLHLMQLRRQRRKPDFKSAIRTLFRESLDFALLWSPLLFSLYAYCLIKPLIPVLSTAVYDELLLNFERSLFGGISPNEGALQIIPIAAMGLLSFSYRYYFILKAIGISLVYAKCSQRVFCELSLAYQAALAIGVLTYLLLPSVGAIYAFPEMYHDILPQLQETGVYVLQTRLWDVYEAVKTMTPSEFDFFSRSAGAVSGVAAFPSLHLAVTTVVLIYLYSCSRLAFWLTAPMNILMTISTVYFGWHYLVDILAGIVLGLFAVYTCRTILDRMCPVESPDIPGPH